MLCPSVVVMVAVCVGVGGNVPPLLNRLAQYCTYAQHIECFGGGTNSTARIMQPRICSFWTLILHTPYPNDLFVGPVTKIDIDWHIQSLLFSTLHVHHVSSLIINNRHFYFLYWLKGHKNFPCNALFVMTKLSLSTFFCHLCA